MANQQATTAELAWLAGIVDGEGYLGLNLETEHWFRPGYNTRQKSVKVELRITNTDAAIIEKAAQVLRHLEVNPYLRQTGITASGRNVYDVSIKRMAPVQRVLLAIKEYLTGSKQERSDLILKFIAKRQSNQGELNPAYAGGANGRKGPRTIRPYTEEELQLVESCRALQSGKGASETTRESQARLLALWKARAAKRKLELDKI